MLSLKILISLCLITSIYAAETKPKLRVCIVGAGMSGATSAFFIQKHLSNYDVHIDVYETNPYVGGRVFTFAPYAETIDQGASIIHGSNEYMKNITQMLGLHYGPPRLYGKQEMGVWDGEKFVITTSLSKPVTTAKMAWRYGLSLPYLQNLINDVHAKWMNIYDVQRNSTAFDTIDSLFESLQLYNLTQQTFTQFVESYYFLNDSRLLKEMASVMTRINYGQDITTINALAGSIGILPMIQPDLWQVEGGNTRIIELLLKYCKLKIWVKHQVAHVREIEDIDGKITYKVTVKDVKERTAFYANYDLVIIACPLEVNNVNFDRITMKTSVVTQIKFDIKKRKFHETHTTFVTGHVDPDYFHVPLANLPGAIVTPESFTSHPSYSTVPFTSIVIQQHLTNKSTHETDEEDMAVYKIFSREELTEKQLDILFSVKEDMATISIPWAAYPKFSVPETFPPVNLMSSVYYVNAIENSASCLEVMAVAANNIALLIKKKFNGVSAPLFSPPKPKPTPQPQPARKPQAKAQAKPPPQPPAKPVAKPTAAPAPHDSL